MGGDVLGVKVQGKYAYVITSGTTDSIVTIDISDPENMASKASSTEDLNYPKAIAVSGNYAYVVDSGVSMLKIFDISDPSSISGKASSTLGLETPEDVFIAGRYAYVVDSGTTDKLVIFDISNFDNIIKRGEISTNISSPHSIYLSGNYAFVANSGSISAYDISDPDNIVAKDTDANGAQTPKDIFVLGNYAYIVETGINDYLSVYDISNPSNIVYKSSLSMTPDPTAVYVSGAYAYVVDDSSGLRVVNVSDPDNLSVVSYYNNSTYLSDSKGVFVAENYVYIAMTSWDRFSTYAINKIETPAISIGSAGIDNLQVYGSSNFYNNLSLGSGLSVSGDSFMQGDFAVAGESSFVGNVGIGTTSPSSMLEIYKPDADFGDVMFEISSSTGIGFKILGDGEAISDKAFNSAGADYAEYFYTEDTDLQAGEVVCVDVSHENAVKRCTRIADSNVMGIVSSNPSIVGNYKEEYAESDNYIIIAMLGQIPAQVSTENGPIRPGDSLTPATEPGYIARANPGDPTVGIALEELEAEMIENSEASSSEEQYELNTDELKILISRRNKSLTVDMVENKITERIANMEIEDEVAILLQSAIDDYNIASTTEAVVDEQIAMFDSVLTIEFDGINNQLMTVSANLDSVIARVSALENSFGEIDHRISVLEESGLGENEPDSNKAFVMTEDGSLILSNDDNYIAERLESTSTPSVAIVEIYSGTTTDKTALIINQEGSGDVADFRAGGVSIVNIASEGEVAVVGEMSIDGRLMVCSGAGCGLALDSAVDETMGDMGVEGTVVAGAFAGYCEDGYIWVPGSSKYGTMPGFCVSQDEMRYEYTEELMANMTQGEAMLTCEALGDAYHLISENEWLTIAENVIRVAENDINTEEDGLQLACASSSEIIVASSTNFILSNGNIINNLAGGIAEWTSETITKAGVFEPQTEDWQEYFMIDNYQGYNVAPPYYYSSENNIGRIKTGTASSSPDYLRAFVRGESALFDLDLSHSPVEATSTIGFRCAK